jgi:hypothetical protein
MRFIKSSLSILVILLLFSACSKKETANNDNLVAPELLMQGKMRATIYGKVVNFNIFRAVYVDSDLESIIQLEGLSDDNSNQQIKLVFSNISLLTNASVQCGVLDAKTNSYVQVWYKSGDSSFTCNGESTKGKITFSAVSNSVLRGDFWINAKSESNSSIKINFIGGFNAFLKNEEPPRMKININNIHYIFDCYATRKDSAGITMLNITAMSSDLKKTLFLNIVGINITPKIYPIIYVDSLNYKMAAYANESGLQIDSYLCDDKNFGYGTINITSINNSIIEGDVYLNAVNIANINDTAKIIGSFKSEISLLK